MPNVLATQSSNYKYKFFLCCLLVSLTSISGQAADQLTRLKYNQPNSTADLGVGLWAWPLPMDFDGDGDLDLIVNCPDKPYNGVYFFENPSGKNKMPTFKKAVRISKGMQNVQVSYIDGKPHVLTPGQRYPDFRTSGLTKPVKLPPSATLPYKGKTRARQWRFVDYNGDSKQDLVVGIGDWTAYGWDDAYDSSGTWTNGPLHGYVFILLNQGSNAQPKYQKPFKVEANGKPVDVFGWPSPNFGDFDGDGDLDLLCGEFLDSFTYFENRGSRTKPSYVEGKKLTYQREIIRMDLQMILPTAVDWDGDDDLDLIVGDEDGRVAFMEHTGKVQGGLPQFLPPKYFRQEAHEIKFGALATPCGFDWDGDGDEDIIVGNTAGYIGFIENLGGSPIRWAEPSLLKAGGKTLRIQAGPNGSIQGPCEAKWGYTTQTVGDWDYDGLPDLVVNSIWGQILWYRNIGRPGNPKLDHPRPVKVHWPGVPPKPAWNWWSPEGNNLVTQWRTTPVVVDFNGDRLNDLVMLDHEGFLCLFERKRTRAGLELFPGKRLFTDDKLNPIQLNKGHAGRSGRRKLAVTDWDADGRLDVLVNSENAEWWRNEATKDGKIVLRNMGNLDGRKVSGHTSSPTVIDLNQDGTPELLVGAEDGYLYHRDIPR